MRSILADLPGTGAPQDRLENLIRDAIERTPRVDWDEDVKPWLGDRVGGFVAGDAASPGKGSVPAAVVIATTDADAARRSLEKARDPKATRRRYRDVEYLVEPDRGGETASGVVDGFVVTGTEAGMKAAIDASKDGRTLDRAGSFKSAIDGVADERMGFAYADLGALIQIASQATGNQFPAGALLGRLAAGKPLVITARAETQALVFEGKPVPGGSLAQSGDRAKSLMDELPASSWAAVAITRLGDTLKAVVTGFAAAFGGEAQLKQQLRDATGIDLDRDILSWIGDVALFADGDSKDTLGGGLVIQSKDPAASRRALTKLAAAITKTDPATRVSAARVPGAFGYQLRSREVPRSAFMVQKDDKVALTYGGREASAALSGGGLSGSSDFERAAAGLGAGFAPLLYASIPPILRVADAFGASGDAGYVKAKPYLTILDDLIAGSSDDNARVRIGFKPSG